MTAETTNEERNAAERIVRAMVADMDRLLAENAALRKPDQKGEAGGALASVRQDQAERVMPLIGPMLDALDDMPNDARSTFRDEHFGLYNTIATIRQEMEAEAAPQPAPEARKLPSEEAVFDVQPQLGAKTSEPSLREIIYGYYAQHFSAPEAADLEQQYIAALLSPAQPLDVPCARCAGTSWVCENHPGKAWTAEGCECGAGMPCPDCDQRRQHQPHDVPAGDADGGWTLADLRTANIDRQAAWCPDQVPDLSFRGNELAGETGEACNVIKKLERERQGWRGSRATPDQLAEELADVVICADLCGLTAGIDLMEAVRAKFDATSEKVGLPQRLAARASRSTRGRD